MKNYLSVHFENRILSCRYSTKWLRFYVRSLMMCWIVFGSIFALSKLSMLAENQSFAIIEVVANLIIVILTISSRTELLNMSKKGYHLNMILNCLIPLNTVLSYIYDINNTENVMAGLMSAIIWAACFTTPNLVYFRKRKELFGFQASNNTSESNVTTNEQQATLSDVAELKLDNDLDDIEIVAQKQIKEKKIKISRVKRLSPTNIVLILFAVAILIQCAWVPHTISKITFSAQNVPHYTAIYKEYHLLSWQEYPSSQNNKPMYTSSIDYGQLSVQILVTVLAFGVVYAVFIFKHQSKEQETQEK